MLKWVLKKWSTDSIEVLGNICGFTTDSIWLITSFSKYHVIQVISLLSLSAWSLSKWMINRDPLTWFAESRHLLGGGRVNLTPVPSQQQTTSGAYHGGGFTQKWEERAGEMKKEMRELQCWQYCSTWFISQYVTCLCSNNCYLSYKCHKQKYIYNSSIILWGFFC